MCAIHRGGTRPAQARHFEDHLADALHTGALCSNDPLCAQRVYWFDDRIEVISPGGPYGIVTTDTFVRPSVVDSRNPILAEAMRVLGLVQRYGFGIPAARAADQRPAGT